MKLVKKHQQAFYEAQGRVSALLNPYRHRCISQYFGKNDAIETFSVYSKEADDGEGRHAYRGIVTVWYGMPICKDEPCHVNFSFSENFLNAALGLKSDYSPEAMALLLEKAIPPLERK